MHRVAQAADKQCRRGQVSTVSEYSEAAHPPTWGICRELATLKLLLSNSRCGLGCGSGPDQGEEDDERPGHAGVEQRHRAVVCVHDVC